jgi:hypothetical protein
MKCLTIFDSLLYSSVHFLDNLDKLTGQRLKAYRKSILNKISSMTIDELNAADKSYLENLKTESKRISKEYWRRMNSIKISLDEQYKNSRVK